MKNKNNYFSIFMKYVSQNVFAMLGVSAYLLADTYFISKAAGADGLTALNLSLPFYGLIYAIGGLIGVGSATRYAILKAQGADESEIDGYFSNGVLWSVLLSIPFILLGIFCPEEMIRLMGGNDEIIAVGTGYFRLFLCFTPFFMCHYQISGFVRNDKDPTIPMIGSLCGSLFNIVFDYIFMFPCGLGITGAALATVMSPAVCMLISSLHFLKKSNTIRFVWHIPSVSMLKNSIPLGVSAMISELSSGVTTAVFNYLLLGLVGNIAVAAYGVIANYALIVIAIFNGIVQGSQPLISKAYGSGENKVMNKYLRYAVMTAVTVAILVIACGFGFTDALVGFFNSEGNLVMAGYAHTGMRLYFLGFLLSGINMVLVGYFSATDQPRISFIGSVLRGVVLICGCAIVLATLMNVNGVWLSYIVAELITLIVLLIMIYIKRKKEIS